MFNRRKSTPTEREETKRALLYRYRQVSRDIENTQNTLTALANSLEGGDELREYMVGEDARLQCLYADLQRIERIARDHSIVLFEEKKSDDTNMRP